MAVLVAGEANVPSITYPVVIVGGGACGLTAALAVRDAGIAVLVIERDPTPRGTTAIKLLLSHTSYAGSIAEANSASH